MIVAMQLVERPRGVASYGAASVKAMPDLVRARFRVVRLEQTLQVASAAVHPVREAMRRHGIGTGPGPGPRRGVRRGNHRLLNHPRLTPTGYCRALSWVRATPVAQP